MLRRSMIVLLLAGLLALPTQGFAQSASDPVQAALAWLKTQQQMDGGFSNGFAPGSDPGTTADAVAAIGAAGLDPKEWRVQDKDPMGYLEAAVSSGSAQGAGLLSKVALAARAAGMDPRRFGGVDLIAGILKDYSTEKGLIGAGPYDSALAIQALASAGEPLPAGAVDGLLSKRLPDGSFAFNGDLTPGAGDSNTTAMVVMALAAAGKVEMVAPSLAYFRQAQNADGGWTYQKPSAFGEATDANSTALVMQALRAAGENLTAWKDPVKALLALQLPSGAFIFNAATPSENLLATVQAIPALVEPKAPATKPAGQPAWYPAVGAGLVVLAGAAAYLFLRRRR